MPATEHQIDHPKVPLTRFHNNTGEFLDLASRQPVVLTSHGRERHIIADSEYFRHLEAAARGQLLKDMNIEAVAAADMTDDDLAAFDAGRPTPQELADDRWND
ncbi:prevent-host-death family protein [Croceicoccus mobilis]|uniref:Antitoxin n=1 Tax=Croceicoccus mobilis TaxID=1703339 RepID=A0A916Z931_9SPHN|nr:prevent-host-death family protein [Croceicoccus mobilis]GGD81778.1 hypothetical protein GCM10010990_34650 [Croceicoccus mobilis]